MMNQSAITRRVIANGKQGHVKVGFNNKNVNENIIMEKATLISGGLQKPWPNITTLGWPQTYIWLQNAIHIFF